jgi:hypothetical protein
MVASYRLNSHEIGVSCCVVVRVSIGFHLRELLAVGNAYVTVFIYLK